MSATLLQVSFFPYFKINGVQPDLVLALVIAWTVLRGLPEGITWAVLGGLCIDLLSGGPFGIFTLAMLVVSLTANLFHGRVFGSSIIIPLGLTFPLTLLFNGLSLLALNLLGRTIDWNLALSEILIPLAVLNSVVMFFIFPLLYLLNRWLNPQPLNF
jgi:rod shape-determining protein MreD